MLDTLGQSVVLVALAIGVPIVESALRRASARAVEQATGQGAGRSVRLEHSPLFGCLAWAGFGLATVVVVATLVFIPLGVYTAIAGLFFVAGWVPMLESRSWLVLDETGVTDYKLWRGVRYMRWDAIRSIRFSVVNSWFAIRGCDGVIIRVLKHLRGISMFQQWAEERLEREVYASEFERARL